MLRRYTVSGVDSVTFCEPIMHLSREWASGRMSGRAPTAPTRPSRRNVDTSIDSCLLQLCATSHRTAELHNMSTLLPSGSCLFGYLYHQSTFHRLVQVPIDKAGNLIKAQDGQMRSDFVIGNDLEHDLCFIRT
jgi:hypothetical protein